MWLAGGPMAFWPCPAHYPAVTESRPGSGRVLKDEVGGRRRSSRPPQATEPRRGSGGVLKDEGGGRGRSSRPPQATERFAVAVENASAGSTALRRHARRYSLCAADAEDACQRGLEILLTKAPSASRSEL